MTHPPTVRYAGTLACLEHKANSAVSDPVMRIVTHREHGKPSVRDPQGKWSSQTSLLDLLIWPPWRQQYCNIYGCRRPLTQHRKPLSQSAERKNLSELTYLQSLYRALVHKAVRYSIVELLRRKLPSSGAWGL